MITIKYVIILPLKVTSNKNEMLEQMTRFFQVIKSTYTVFKRHH